MGYTTEFEGEFYLDKELDQELFIFLNNFAGNRRMKRNTDPKYGIEGEFFIQDYMESKNDTSIIDRNHPPRTQPSLYCYWKPLKNKKGLCAIEADNFYNYTEWLIYLINTFLQPNGYSLNGEVYYYGETREDFGLIKVTNNIVEAIEGQEIFENTKNEFDQLLITLNKMKINNPYGILDLNQNATIEQIESAYSLKIEEYQDSKFEKYSPEFQELARIKRKKLYEAKTILLKLYQE